MKQMAHQHDALLNEPCVACHGANWYELMPSSPYARHVPRLDWITVASEAAWLLVMLVLAYFVIAWVLG